ncbi:hypothetical protein ACLOJK_028073 [Asimina triloba]
MLNEQFITLSRYNIPPVLPISQSSTHIGKSASDGGANGVLTVDLMLTLSHSFAPKSKLLINAR